MVDNQDQWWESNGNEELSTGSINPSNNVFSGNVSNFSSSQTGNDTNPIDANKFVVSQFLVGLILVPIIASFLMSFLIISSDLRDDDTYYFDSAYKPEFEGSIIIDGEDLRTSEITFDIPSFSLELIEDNDYFFYTSVNAEYNVNYEDNGGCWWEAWDGMEYSVAQSEDDDFWISMSCWGVLEEYDFYFQKNGQVISYATNYNGEVEYINVDGDEDISISSFFQSLIPFLIPVIYFGMIIWSFLSKKKSLGFGLLGGIFVAPFSFCLSMIFLSFIFWEV